MKNRAMSVRFPVLNGRVVRVIFARDVPATGRRLGADLHDADAAYIHPEDAEGKRRTSWLVFGRSPSPGTVAHEAAHAVRALFSQVGIVEDDENFSYHLDYLVEHIHKFLERQK